MRGQALKDADRRDAIAVLANEAFARQIGAEGLGRSFRLKNDPQRFEIVGVVPVIRDESFGSMVNPAAFYLSYREALRWKRVEGAVSFGMAVALRVAGDPESIVPALRAEVLALDPNLPLRDVRMLQDRLSDRFSEPGFYASAVGAFALVALGLAASGVYGLISYSVTQRLREVGIRMALGAERKDVLRLVLGQGVRLLLVGLVMGTATSLGLSRWIASRLFGILPTDAGTYVSVVGILSLVTLIAAFLPARRATFIDPVVALRHD